MKRGRPERPAGPSRRCRTLLLEISRYLDGELSPARRRLVEQHIAGCTCCDTMAQRLQTVIRMSRDERKTPPRDVMRRAAARVRRLIAG